MKKKISGALLAAFVLISFAPAAPAAALSCMDPASMIDYYVNEDSYVIFTAEAGETKEFVKESADAEGLDPNRQHDSGYTAQYVEVLTAHKGYPESLQWVYYEKNSTWGYLCAGGPAEVGEEALYIVSQSASQFDLPQVVNSYPVDSPLAADIIAALEEVEIDYEPAVTEITPENWQERLRTELMEMIFILRIKFAEFKFWSAQ